MEEQNNDLIFRLFRDIRVQLCDEKTTAETLLINKIYIMHIFNNTPRKKKN